MGSGARLRARGATQKAASSDPPLAGPATERSEIAKGRSLCPKGSAGGRWQSTGVYWIALYQKLETAGLEVVLVNARHVKHVPGRKSDVQDCQWLQQLHSFGLLSGSFRPEDLVCQLRSLQRHRRD